MTKDPWWTHQGSFTCVGLRDVLPSGVRRLWGTCAMMGIKGRTRWLWATGSFSGEDYFFLGAGFFLAGAALFFGGAVFLPGTGAGANGFAPFLPGAGAALLFGGALFLGAGFFDAITWSVPSAS